MQRNSKHRSNRRADELSSPRDSITLRTVLREFATVGGIVFAVAWSGPAMPNLQQTLGSYFDVYVTAAKAPHAGHRHLQVQQDNFVMQSSGRMRAFTGRAYLPQAVRPGCLWMSCIDG